MTVLNFEPGRDAVLEKLARAQTLQPAAVRKVLPSVKADLATLMDTARLKALSPEKKAEADKLRQECEETVQQIEKTLGQS